MNSISRLGPNRWFSQGDSRFHPDNIIFSGRQTNILAIIDKKTGKIVWQVGPEYSGTPALEKLGWIIGPHHVHMIPQGLPGEGNILVFDNGGSAGYGTPNPGCPTGVGYALRDYSRVVEFNPLTLQIVWQYPPPSPQGGAAMHYLKLYSKFISSAQRLLNGNTFITEGGCGRLIEVTPSHEIVWEYVSPFYSKRMLLNHIYRLTGCHITGYLSYINPKKRLCTHRRIAIFRSNDTLYYLIKRGLDNISGLVETVPALYVGNQVSFQIEGLG
jgi:hypothetical protein